MRARTKRFNFIFQWKTPLDGINGSLSFPEHPTGISEKIEQKNVRKPYKLLIITTLLLIIHGVAYFFLTYNRG